jgi:signal transduction histidine kinase
VPVVLLVVLGVLEVASDRMYELSDAARLGGAVLSALPFLWRARMPLVAVSAVTLLLLGRQELGDLGTPAISQNFYLYFAMFVVGAYARSVPAALLGWVIVFGGGLYAIHLEGVDYPPDAYVFYSVSLTASALVGVAVRQRVRQAVELDRVRTRLAERRRAAVAAAVAAERMHVARELHDVVGHSVTVMAVQAGAAVAMSERDPDGAREAAESVVEYESVVRAELDQLLRALHSADEAPPSPAGLADLASLVERTRRAGLPVRLESDGDLSGVAPWLIATVYRIVQESLTNVRRHAGSAPTTVAVGVDPSRVTVEVTNAPGSARDARPGGGAGAGIAGMRERTLVHGGAFEAGPTPEGGWRVRAVLPAGDREPDPSPA